MFGQNLIYMNQIILITIEIKEIFFIHSHTNTNKLWLKDLRVL